MASVGHERTSAAASFVGVRAYVLAHLWMRIGSEVADDLMTERL